MNWDAIGATGEWAGAIAVVATLGYLAVQIRQNASSMRSSAELEASRQFTALVTRVSGDRELQRIWDEVIEEQALSLEDHRQWLFFMAEMFHLSEGIFTQYRKGFLSIETWSEYERLMVGFLQSNVAKEWWEGGNGPFSSEFRAHVESLLTVEPTWTLPRTIAMRGNDA